MKYLTALLLMIAFRSFAQDQTELKESDIEALTKTMNAENRAKFESELKKEKGASISSTQTTQEPTPLPPAVDLNSINTSGMSATDKEMLKNVTEQMNQLKTMTEEMQKELDN